MHAQCILRSADLRFRTYAGVRRPEHILQLKGGNLIPVNAFFRNKSDPDHSFSSFLPAFRQEL
jgi:hypothetical protein